jgi:hypothetical protein
MILKKFNDCKEGYITMKSSFLISLVLTALFANVAWGQLSTKPSAEDLKPNTKTHFDKFSDRLKIGYFGVLTTPHFDDMEKGQWRNAAISPELGNAPKGEHKNQDTWPTNMWNQISFNYNFGAKMNFVINPRFMVPLANGRDMKAPEDRSFIMLDDFLIGFQGVVYSTDDKKFNLWIRPGMRMPTSRASRNSVNSGFGNLSRQLELGANPTYDFNKKWQLGAFTQWRMWVYEERYNWSRFRFYTAPYIQYTITDTTRVQAYYENMYENTKRWKSVNGKKPVFQDIWQNVYVGVSHDVTSKFNVFPYISCFVNDTPVTDKSLWIGAWVSYQIK